MLAVELKIVNIGSVCSFKVLVANASEPKVHPMNLKHKASMLFHEGCWVSMVIGNYITYMSRWFSFSTSCGTKNLEYMQCRFRVLLKT